MGELDQIDTAMIVMRTASGKQCHINNSRTAVYGYDQRIELMGSAGMVQSGNRKPHEMKRYSASSGEVAEPYLYFFIERYTEAFMAEIDAFVDAIESGKEPEPSFEDGRRALILAEAAYASTPREAAGPGFRDRLTADHARRSDAPLRDGSCNAPRKGLKSR